VGGIQAYCVLYYTVLYSVILKIWSAVLLMIRDPKVDMVPYSTISYHAVLYCAL